MLLVMGTGSTHRTWHLHQVPALIEAGYRVITFDNRGIEPTDMCADGITIDDMVGDVVALIEYLDLAPCRIVGTSMGAHVVQEVALSRPELVQRCVFMATRGRTDVLRKRLSESEIELYDSKANVPPRYRAAVRAMQNLSPHTLDDEARIADWLDVLEFSGAGGTPGLRAQLELDYMPNRLSAYQAITVPCHVIAFADDLITPPRYGREVADSIPGATFDQVEACGHYGYLENPVEVNRILLEFLRAG